MRDELSAGQAYAKAFESGRAFVARMVEAYAERGLTAYKLDRPEWVHPEIIEYFRRQGFSYDDATGVLSWRIPGPPSAN